jgi:hypothetical protein
LKKLAMNAGGKKIFCPLILEDFRRNCARQLGLPVIGHANRRLSHPRFIETEQFPSRLEQLLPLVRA